MITNHPKHAGGHCGQHPSSAISNGTQQALKGLCRARHRPFFVLCCWSGTSLSRGRAPHSSDVRDTPECSPTRVDLSLRRGLFLYLGCTVLLSMVYIIGVVNQLLTHERLRVLHLSMPTARLLRSPIHGILTLNRLTTR